MILAQGRFWRAQVRKDGEAVVLQVLKDSLPTDLEEIRDLRIEVPLSDWNRVVRHLRADRRLLGGVLLGCAKNEENLSAAIGSDRILHALQGVVSDATMGLVEEGLLTLVPSERET